MPPKNKFFKGPIFVLILLLLVLGIAAMLLRSASQSESTPADTASEVPVRSDGDDFDGLAVFPTWSLLDPAKFPVLIDGEARGFWFFEATFPVEVISPDGAVLARGFAQAQEEWMTEDVVPFYIELNTVEGVEDFVGMAALVLHKANPSDLPKNDAKFTTQIFIDTTQ